MRVCECVSFSDFCRNFILEKALDLLNYAILEAWHGHNHNFWPALKRFKYRRYTTKQTLPGLPSTANNYQ